jgi:ribosomal protein L16 Arg81 hydroxylase
MRVSFVVSACMLIVGNEQSRPTFVEALATRHITDGGSFAQHQHRCCNIFRSLSSNNIAAGTWGQHQRRSLSVRHATVVPDSNPQKQASETTFDTAKLLESISNARPAAEQWGDMFGLGKEEQAFFCLFRGMRDTTTLGLKGQPFHLKSSDVQEALGYEGREDGPYKGFFTRDDLEKAVNDDFLNADRGSTDNRKGWQIAAVSEPRGNSFEEARMTMEEVEAALDKGTVIFNSAGAHIPKLAGPNLAITDGSGLPCALNLYVTAPGKRTSAPPHTDKQDVVVVQTQGKKHWRVYSPPEPSLKPTADMFARGKGADNMPLHSLESDLGCKLLLETTLNTGDVLFVPAAFPHTTDTANENDEMSIHLTFGLDTHVWDLDYLSLRRFALRRACVADTALGQPNEEDNRYVGRCNELPDDIRKDLFAALPQGLLDDTPEAEILLEEVVGELKRISKAVDEETFSKVDGSVWREATERLRQQGRELLEIHQDMLSAAVEEGRTRDAEDAMTAHLDESGRKTLSPERMQRLSLFRVPRYFQKINDSMQELRDWTYGGKPSDTSDEEPALPENWAFTMPIKPGDSVEADLGGAFFPATVTKVLGGGSAFEVQFFDGDKETGLDRSMIKLLVPPAVEEEVDTSSMTPKQLKRWKKQQEKKAKQ